MKEFNRQAAHSLSAAALISGAAEKRVLTGELVFVNVSRPLTSAPRLTGSRTMYERVRETARI
jgi:hypothetical protein